MSESKSYTFEEIHQNRIRIKSIKDKKFIEVYDFCKNVGEIMFIDVLVCERPLVYVSFVHRKDAFAAFTKINEETTMVAAFSNEQSREHPNELFVLDISKLDEFEQIRLLHEDKGIQKQVMEEYFTSNNNSGKPRSKPFDYKALNEKLQSDPELHNRRNKKRKILRHNRGIALKNFDWASCLPKSINETNSVTCDWSDFDIDNQEIKNQQDRLENDKTEEIVNDTHLKEGNLSGSDITLNSLKQDNLVADTEDDEEYDDELSLTSWSVFNGQPKDWSKLRLPKRKSLAEYFPCLKNIENLRASWD